MLLSFATFVQLSAIDGSTLRAPEEERDDRADAFALACVGVAKARRELADAEAEPMAMESRAW